MHIEETLQNSTIMSVSYNDLNRLNSTQIKKSSARWNTICYNAVQIHGCKIKDFYWERQENPRDLQHITFQSVPYQLPTWRKSCRNLRQITLQSASSYITICVKLHYNLRQVTWLSASKCERDRMQSQGRQHGKGCLSLVNGWKGNDNSP